MGVGEVNKKLRKNDDFDNLNIDWFDVANVKIKHEYLPLENYIYCEMRLPALERSMTDYDHEMLKEMCYWDTYHQMRYVSVDNSDFHSMVKKEEIHKLRLESDGKIFTFYISKNRTVGFMEYDYFTAPLIYGLHPIRNFIRRAPCTKLDPECDTCQDDVDASITSFLGLNENITATYDKYCFAHPEEIHNIVVAYTIDVEHDLHNCDNVTPPEYFILDLDNIYFREADFNYNEWKEKVMKRRSEFDGQMYRLYDGGTSGNTGSISFVTGRMSQGVSVSVDEYNMKQGENIPSDMQEAIEEMDFDKFWMCDFKNANARNTLHKHQFNQWVWFGNTDKDGFFCAWDMTETFDESSVDTGEETSAVKDQLAQIGSMFGWGFDESGEVGRCAVFEHMFPRFPGIEYEVFTELIPDRTPKPFG